MLACKPVTDTPCVMYIAVSKDTGCHCLLELLDVVIYEVVKPQIDINGSTNLAHGLECHRGNNMGMFPTCEGRAPGSPRFLE